MSKALIIYHGNCYDGFTAAWIAEEAMILENVRVELFPARYGDPPPDVEGRDVTVLDFSYPREVMLEMHAKASHLQVLDHHKTAEADCAGLDFCKFDMDRSGCRMAWDHYFGGPPPEWVAHIEDRDLWRFALDGTRDVHAYVASLPMTTEAWDSLSKTPIADVKAGGRAIAGYIDTYCEKAAQESYLVDWGADRPVAVVNVPYQNASEMASRLLDKSPDAAFCAGWFMRADGRIQFSLRSRGDFDVSSVAKRFGGGGHAGAAGFDLSLEESLDYIRPKSA